MLRPWVPLIALALLTVVGFMVPGLMTALGGCLLGAALGSEVLFRVRLGLERGRARRKLRSARERAAALDWSVIDNSMARDRVQRDCERPATLGVCTGMECLVYKTCNFNIKKPLP